MCIYVLFPYRKQKDVASASPSAGYTPRQRLLTPYTARRCNIVGRRIVSSYEDWQILDAA